MLEEIDGLLVQQLQRDGRASFQALGRAVGLTRTAARARVSRLLAAGVIKVVALPDAAVAGQAVVAHAGEWIQYSTPEPEGAEYIAVCVPAFSMETVHRDAG